MREERAEKSMWECECVWVTGESESENRRNWLICCCHVNRSSSTLQRPRLKLHKPKHTNLTATKSIVVSLAYCILHSITKTTHNAWAIMRPTTNRIPTNANLKEEDKCLHNSNTSHFTIPVTAAAKNQERAKHFECKWTNERMNEEDASFAIFTFCFSYFFTIITLFNHHHCQIAQSHCLQCGH